MSKDEYLTPLSGKVRGTTFLDAKVSSNDSALLGPPSVEFAPYGKVPTNKPRKDGRQGTIDQDQEFIDFLESLTNPTPKATLVDGGSDKEAKGGDEKEVTPLIQYLRDKKANKGKDAATPSKVLKHGRQDSKDNKGGSAEKKQVPKTSKESVASEKRSASAIKVEKAAREAVKALNKQVNASTNKSPAASATLAASSGKAQDTTQTPATPPPKVERKRERGNASALAKMVQRDLGLTGSPTGRGKRDSNTTVSSAAASAQTSTTSAAPKENIENSSIQTSDAKSVPATTNVTQAASSTSEATQPPAGPATARNQVKSTSTQRSNASRVVQSTTANKDPNTSTTPSSATQAFLKHANPSQGITEPLLEEAFTPFGTVTKVEIDKKKGFAYINFSSSDALQKAIAASPVNVAQGQVVVLERKTGPSLQNRNTRGGGQAAGGRGSPSSSNVRGGRGGSVRGRGRAQASAAKTTSTTPSSQTATASTANSAKPGKSPEAKKPANKPTPETAPQS